jgi:hydroxypyruvate isomerase
MMAMSAVAAAGGMSGAPSAVSRQSSAAGPPGRLRQSVCRWTYGSMPLAELCRAAKDIGLAGIDLLSREDWPRVRDMGLVCSMAYAVDRRDLIARGFNDPANHAMLLAELEEAIPLAAAAGVPNIIAMFGNRSGRSDAEAVEACVAGVRRIAPLAEEKGITVCLELLNSRVDHHGYQGDRTSFGAAVVGAVGSPRVKLLYDVYHMQIMEGDVIRTIRENIRWIGHVHTGGVPGRHEIDETQELNYPAIVRALADAGYTGFVAHEFEPTGEPLASLRRAVQLCTV